jgi:molybdate transport system substrate-binding protein
MQNLHEFMRFDMKPVPHCSALARRHFLAMGAGIGLGCTGLASAGVASQRVQNASAVPVRVLAASDLKFALTRVASQYQQETGQWVEVTFGSSGNMARQIQQGLPADIFMSADEDFALQLARTGLTRGGDTGVLYALGRIALYLAPGSPIAPDAQLQGVREHWTQVQKFAIANPEHAPYGRAAREALQNLKLWNLVQPRLVLGENIAQATQYVSTGAAQAGITALSLVMAPALQGQGQFVALPPGLHAPLRQRMVLLSRASDAASAFYKYLQQPPVRAVMAQYGFVPPP